MAKWFWKVSTCLLVLQFVIPSHRHREQVKHPDDETDPNRIDRVLRRFALLVYPLLMAFAACLSILLSAFLFALAIAAKLPIPRIDRAVQWVVVKLSEVLGDSYVLVHCPVQYAAMRTQVAHDLAWLQERCENVAVVAHSQGAAIAHQVLKDDARLRTDVRSFITLGQGISKLHMLQHLDWDPDLIRKTFWTRIIVCVGLGIAGLPMLVLTLSRWFELPVLGLLTDPLGFCLFVVVGLAVIRVGVRVILNADVLRRVCGDLCLPGAGTDFSWIDYYASADPVSSGPLAEGCHATAPGRGSASACALTHPRPCSEVYNQASLLSDHTGYLRNQDQLISRLVNDLVAAAYGGSASPSVKPQLVPEHYLKEVGTRRRQRMRWLVAGRFFAFGIGATAAWLLPARVFGGPMNWSMRHVAPQVVMNDIQTRLVATLLVAAVVYFGAVFPIWSLIDRRRVRSFFTARKSRVEPQGRDPERLQSSPQQGMGEEPVTT
jgi:hypothetical protein